MRGHDGGLDGFLSSCHYLPERGVGFVILFNSTARGVLPAYVETRKLVVDYLLADAPPPSPPPPVRVDERELRQWVGDYGFANPRQQLFASLERLVRPGLRIRLVAGRLRLTEHPFGRLDVALLSLGGGRFRYPLHSGSNVALAHDAEGRRAVVVNGQYLVEEPGWLAPLYCYGLRALLWLLLSALALPVAALIWRRRGVPVGWAAPLVAAVSFFATPVLFVVAVQLGIFGERNPLTLAIFGCTIAFALGAFVALMQALVRLGQPLPLIVRLHRLMIAIVATAAAAFFAAHGLIGLRLWSY
jgi:hypothetical protein